MITGIIVILATIYICVYEATFFHESGHLFIARRYNYCRARIYLKRAHPLIKYKDCEIIRDKNMKSYGHTDLANNYLVYTDEQIKKIAIAGTAASVITILIIGLIGTCIEVYLSRNSIVNEALALTELALTAFFAIYYIMKHEFDTEEWSDKNIRKAPDDFRRHMEREVKKAKCQR